LLSIVIVVKSGQGVGAGCETGDVSFVGGDGARERIEAAKAKIKSETVNGTSLRLFMDGPPEEELVNLSGLYHRDSRDSRDSLADRA
jgi:hypothetical protein